MTQKRMFESQLKNELNKFDLDSALSLVERVMSEEENGYELSKAESRLFERLIVCIESYERNLYRL